MRKKLKILVLALLIISLPVLFPSNIQSFANTYPEIIRVGLYFGTSSASNVSFNSKSGLEAGYYKNGQFTALISQTGGQQVIVRKDSYFIMSPGGILEEYNPNEGVPYSGQTFGPYHIQIGGNVPDITSAKNLSDQLNQKGIEAYPVFEDGWKVWTGFYSDRVKADADINNIRGEVGDVSLSIVGPSDNRLIIYNTKFKPLMIFGPDNLYLTVRPNDSNNLKILSVNGKNYRGEIEIRRFPDSDLTVINVINIEEYLYGVVPKEIGYSSPLEALKAQAVAARTYAYRSMGSYAKWDFDVVNTVLSQVYDGYDAERPSTNRAVDETKGKKVLYNGKPASLFYFSSSGGMTEDNVYVWGSDIPYLKSVPDPYESGTSYNYNWTRTFTAEDIKLKLFLSGVEIGDIITMEALEYTPAGRVNSLRITGTKGSITYYRENIREILSDSSGYLPSRMFTISSDNSSGSQNNIVSVISDSGKANINVYGTKVITSQGIQSIASASGALKIRGKDTTAIITGTVPTGTFVLTGKGWGHGVGMSQSGAIGFAQNGYTYDQILTHYFKGTVVE
jgi:stage II sporulation protein D